MAVGSVSPAASDVINSRRDTNRIFGGQRKIWNREGVTYCHCTWNRCSMLANSMHISVSFYWNQNDVIAQDGRCRYYLSHEMPPLRIVTHDIIILIDSETGYMREVIVCIICSNCRSKISQKGVTFVSWRNMLECSVLRRCFAASIYTYIRTRASQPASTPNSCALYTTICRRVHCVEHVHSAKHILKLWLWLWHIVRLPLQWQNTIVCSSNDTHWIENESDSGGAGRQPATTSEPGG